MSQSDSPSPEAQKAFIKAYDEFQVRILGKEKMNAKEADELRDYVKKRTDLNKNENELTDEQSAWKTIYKILDKEFEKTVGKDTKIKIDELKALKETFERASYSLDEVTKNGREIEELLIKQWANISINFSGEENDYRMYEEKLSERLVKDKSLSNQQRVEIAQAILKLVSKYREIMVMPLQSSLDELHLKIINCENAFNRRALEPMQDEAKSFVQDYAEWLALTKELYQGRVKAVTAVRGKVEADEFIPKHAIEHGGDISVNIPAEDFANLVASYSTLAKMGSEAEREIAPKRDALSTKLFGKHEEYMNLTEPNTTAQPAEVAINPLEGKAWFRLAKVVYVCSFLLLGLIILALFASNDADLYSAAFWVALIGIGILIAIKKAFYYVVIGKTTWKK